MIQENSAHTGVDFSLKLGLTKIVLTPGLPLPLLVFRVFLIQNAMTLI